jgi:peptidyl-prolyl cis-trans isomerase C
MLFASSQWRAQIGLAALLAAMCLVSGGRAWGQGQPAASRSKPTEAKPAEVTKPSESAMKPGEMLKSPSDPVVGVVEGHMIYLSEVGRAVPQLPENLRGLPFDMLFPVVLDRIIDHEALVAAARRIHLDQDPAVRRDIQAATDRVLEAALLAREAGPNATEDKIQARYTRQYVGKPATEETHARHILVANEAEAKRLITELNQGSDFPTLASQNSKDPDRENGGDLGFFRRDQVWPEFADAAFALQPGQFSQTPIHNEFGWHIVKVEERRIVAPPSYSEVHDMLRQALLQEAVQRKIDQARSQLAIHKFNVDGTPLGAGPDVTSAPPPMVKPQDNPSRP